MAETSQTIPKYHRIAQDMIQMIREGNLELGARIPSENEIIRTYGVSNTTARKALQEIEHAGWVVKVKGRGTFVENNKVERSADKILSFTRNMLQAGRKPSTRLLDARVLAKGYSSTVNGRRYAIKHPVFKIHRLRLADDLPVMLEVRYISMAFC
ncbi:MAG: GntR family transcriptional regulator, partial [Phycisphaerae bacterium]|nr:GntR family transcriptional regulator [Phycisphaerae bacterium]